MSHTSVMLIDDNPKFLRIASLFLEGNDEVTVVSSLNGGTDALAKANELRPDIVIVDLAMPDVPGLEVIPSIRKELPDTGIIALTLYDTDTYRQAALAAGADSFIAKSSMHVDLFPAIDELMEKRKQQSKSSAPPKNILILEDDTGLRNIYSRALKHGGYEVYPAATLEKANALLDQRNYAVFICDIQLGSEDSMALLDERRAEFQEAGTQIIMVSGHSQYQFLREDFEAEFFMHKPVSLSTLITLINRLMNHQEVQKHTPDLSRDFNSRNKITAEPSLNKPE